MIDFIPTRLIRLALAAAHIALFVPGAFARSWTIETVDDYHVGTYNSIAVDSFGQPHISYYDQANGNVKYATKSGGAWVREVVAKAGPVNGASYVAVYTSIALDFAGTPHIIYYDYDQHQLKYAAKSGRAWTIEIVDSAGGLTGAFPSLALDSSYNPHVSYLGFAPGDGSGSLKYATKSGGLWVVEVVDSDGDTGEETSLAIDASNHPHIAYLRYPSILAHSENTLRYAAKTGRGWTLEEIVGQPAGSPPVRMTHCAIAVDTAGVPWVSYHDYVNGFLMFATRPDGNWHVGTVDTGIGDGTTPQANVGRFSSIAMDSALTPHIAYFDITNVNLKYAFWPKPNWNIEVVDSLRAGSYSRIAIDESDNPHISYYSQSDYSLKYAALVDSTPTPTPSKPFPNTRVISPDDFAYKITVETQCTESIGRLCLHNEIVRVCVGGSCFDTPRPLIGPLCEICRLSASAAIGGGIAVAGLVGAALLIAWRRPDVRKP
jgi:hypothetical protein